MISSFHQNGYGSDAMEIVEQSKVQRKRGVKRAAEWEIEPEAKRRRVEHCTTSDNVLSKFNGLSVMALLGMFKESFTVGEYNLAHDLKIVLLCKGIPEQTINGFLDS